VTKADEERRDGDAKLKSKIEISSGSAFEFSTAKN